MNNAANWRYLRGMATCLHQESVNLSNIPSALNVLCDQLDGLTSQPLERRSWYAALSAYTQAKQALGAHLASAAEVAEAYPTMEQFWQAATAQQKGQTAGTIWDTYEHGARRRLETTFAQSFGSPDAVLVNSGMAAVHVALAGALHPGDTLLTHQRSYFETSELLDHVYAPTGIRVVRVDMTSSKRITAAVRQHRPAVVLAETALNAPACSVPDFADADLGHSGPLVLIDNSILSHATNFEALTHTTGAARLLIVESAIKYATHDCSAGVLYGGGNEIDAVRTYARRTGQLLQSKAFHYIRDHEVRALHQRLSLHSDRNRRFVHCLTAAPIEAVNTDTSAAAADGTFAELVRRSGPGSLLFLRFPTLPPDSYSNVMNEWAARCRDRGLRLDIRAGFGWDITSARSYQSTFLNQSDAPTFLRVSMGIGPEEEVADIAAELCTVVNKLAAGSRSAH